MTYYHIIIDPASDALNSEVGTRIGDQLHVMTTELPDLDTPGILGVFGWEGNPNYVIAHKGDYATRTMAYAGWPEITKEQFDALAADPVAA